MTNTLITQHTHITLYCISTLVCNKFPTEAPYNLTLLLLFIHDHVLPGLKWYSFGEGTGEEGGANVWDSALVSTKWGSLQLKVGHSGFGGPCGPGSSAASRCSVLQFPWRTGLTGASLAKSHKDIYMLSVTARLPVTSIIMRNYKDEELHEEQFLPRMTWES